jgi:hypothetical protein
MASGNPRDLPAYALADLSPKNEHVLLSPAVRWRVVMEQTTSLSHDVLLEAVLRLRQAGEKSPGRISELLQLPVELVRHLLVQVTTQRLQASADGKIKAGRTVVAWVYRDVATDEIWPDPGLESTPLPLRFTGRDHAFFQSGTAGRPVRINCLLLKPDPHESAEPSMLELARFSRATSDPNRRTVIVSSGEPCLVASPLTATPTGVAVTTTRGTPHPSLSRYLAIKATEREQVARWLASVPRFAGESRSGLPLRGAVDDLNDVLAEWRHDQRAETALIVLSRIELALRRFCDQCWYMAGIDPAAAPTWSEDTVGELGKRLELDPGTAQQLAAAAPGGLTAFVGLLAMASPPSAEGVVNTGALAMLVRLAVRWTSLSGGAMQPRLLEALAAETTTLCNQLVEVGES